VLGGFGDLIVAQRQPDGIELFRIFDGKIRRPAGVILMSSTEPSAA
jgi:hypothetical protein